MGAKFLTQQWFEAGDLSQRPVTQGAWVPLRQFETKTEGQIGAPGWVEQIIGVVSLIVPIDLKNEAMVIGWTEVGAITTAPQFDGGAYHPAGSFLLQLAGGKEVLTHAVPRYDFDSLRKQEWHLNQDMEIALGLSREGEQWVRPEDDYRDVARLKRDGQSGPVCLEMRSEYLEGRAATTD